MISKFCGLMSLCSKLHTRKTRLQRKKLRSRQMNFSKLVSFGARNFFTKFGIPQVHSIDKKGRK